MNAKNKRHKTTIFTRGASTLCNIYGTEKWVIKHECGNYATFNWSDWLLPAFLNTDGSWEAIKELVNEEIRRIRCLDTTQYT